MDDSKTFVIKFLLQIKNNGKSLEMQFSLDPKYVPIISLSSSVLKEEINYDTESS